VPLFLFGLLFITIAGGLFALGAALAAPSSSIGFRLRALMPNRAEQAPQRRPLKERLKDDLVEPLAAFIPASPRDLSHSRELLMMAGYREQRHVTLYNGIRVLLAIVILILCLATGIAEHRMFLVLAGVALAYVVPRFTLKRLISKRQLRIRLGLPDALDLAVICVEAGL